MNKPQTPPKSVTLRTKGNTAPHKKAEDLAEEPEMKELACMVEAGELDTERTADFIQSEENKRIYP